MAQKTSTSPPQKVKVGDFEYEVRTVTIWNDGGRSGTIDDKVPPITKVQYKPGPSLADPFPQFQDLADRTGNSNVNNGWSFRPVAGPDFKKVLVEKGPNSLSSKLDTASINQLTKDAKVPKTVAQQSLNKTALTQQNKALAAANQDPTAAAGGQNTSQASRETANQSEVSKITNVDLNIAESGQQRDKSGSFGNYRYPEDIGSTKQDVIKFSMLKYQPRELTSSDTYRGGDLGGFKSRSPNRTTLGSVVLPITSGISESNAVEWTSQTMSPGEALAANIALSSIKEGLGKGAEVVGGAASGVAGAGNENVKTAIATGFAEAATGVGNLLSRTQGAIFNPNMELLFNGPTLRPFQFTFKMSARSRKEAQQIIKIIRFFKQGMSPQRSQSNLFLKAPHTFRIQYLHRPLGEANDHPYIGAIKECALQNFVVNYTPEAQYATFYDGVLVSYEIQMTFQELEPIFNEDYGNEGNEMPFDLLFRENPSTKP